MSVSEGRDDRLSIGHYDCKTTWKNHPFALWYQERT